MKDKKTPRRLRIALLLLVGCATGGRILPDPEHLAAAGYGEVEALRSGRATYVKECAACHRMYWPGEHSPRRWESLAQDMGERAGLPPEAIEELTLFLVSGSRQARE